MAEAKDKTPVLIIEIAGGLGNQMFQYAFCLKLRSLGYPCKLYFDPTQQKHNGYELDKVFGIREAFATEEELDKVLDKDKVMFSRVRRKFTGPQPSFYWEHDKGYRFKPEIFNLPRPIYLQGCWLSEKYFEDIRDEIKAAFHFTKFTEQKNILMAGQVKDGPDSAGIHIRRGDYKSSTVHRQLNYPDYLKKAVAILRGQLTKIHLYIFSDDTEFAKSVFNGWDAGDVDFIDWNNGEDSFNDMHLMSLCRHNIICNSTFSWWAAWLNENLQKIVISPKDWFTTDFLNQNDIVPEGWMTV